MIKRNEIRKMLERNNRNANITDDMDSDTSIQNTEETFKEYLFDNFVKFSNREKQNKNIKPKLGEIYTCDLGVNVGSELDNIRPCIIVTSDKYNEKSSVVTVVPISKKTKLFFHQIEINDYTVEEIETMIEGTAKLEQITTISKGKLGRKIGKMSKKGIKLIHKAMQYHFALDSSENY